MSRVLESTAGLRLPPVRRPLEPAPSNDLVRFDSILQLSSTLSPSQPATARPLDGRGAPAADLREPRTRPSYDADDRDRAASSESPNTPASTPSDEQRVHAPEGDPPRQSADVSDQAASQREGDGDHRQADHESSDVEEKGPPTGPHAATNIEARERAALKSGRSGQKVVDAEGHAGEMESGKDDATAEKAVDPNAEPKSSSAEDSVGTLPGPGEILDETSAEPNSGEPSPHVMQNGARLTKPERRDDSNEAGLLDAEAESQSEPAGQAGSEPAQRPAAAADAAAVPALFAGSGTTGRGRASADGATRRATSDGAHEDMPLASEKTANEATQNSLPGPNPARLPAPTEIPSIDAATEETTSIAGDKTPAADPAPLHAGQDARRDVRPSLPTSSADQGGTAGKAVPGGTDAGRFVHRVTRAVELAHQRGEALQIRLSPPELGSLRIEITMRGGALTAHLEADTAAARNALLDHLPVLRERLAEQEIRIERFDVDVRDESDGRSHEHSSAFQDQRRPAAKGKPVTLHTEVAVGEQEPTKPGQIPVWIGNGQLNLIV